MRLLDISKVLFDVIVVIHYSGKRLGSASSPQDSRMASWRTRLETLDFGGQSKQ